MHERTAQVAMLRCEDERAVAREDAVVREEPLEIRLGGAPLAVVMRTPGDDEELALGFLVSERVVRSVDDVVSVRHSPQLSDPDAEDNAIQVVLAAGVEVDLDALRRNLYASASCGICGKATLENVLREAPALDDASRFPASLFYALPRRLSGEQALFARTGGLHAAALFDADGSLLVAREDVGRHNAVDKVIGWSLRRGRFPLEGHVLLVSGRISYEIAQKALVARLPVVAAVSAPSSLAVELAERSGMALIGFLRGTTLNVYGNRERILR